MQHVGIRQLRADAATMVRRASTGERIVVTVNGQPTAELGPPGAASGAATIDDLIARGMIRAPRRRDPFNIGEPIPVWRGTRLDRLLAELRG